MSERKTPILLRPAAMSGGVHALYRYRHKRLANGRDVIEASYNGKQDVTADFDVLVLKTLLDPDSPNIVGILDGVADGETLTDAERAEVRAFRERLKALIVRHNARLDAVVAHE